MTSAIYQFLDKQNVPGISTELLYRAVGLIVIVLLAFLATWIARAWFLRAFQALVKKTKFKWDDVLLENKVLSRVAHLAPAGWFEAYPTLSLVLCMESRGRYFSHQVAY